MGKTTKDQYERECPKCGDVIIYKSYSGFYNANRNESKCKPCYQAEAGKARSETWAKRREKNPKEYFKHCPSCGERQDYSSSRALWSAKKNDSVCMDCANIQISETLKRKYDNGELEVVSARADFRERKEWKRNCPDCGDELGYTSKWSMQRSEKNNSVCNSCANYVYNKTWNDVVSEESIKKMRASKAGFDSWEDYVEGYPEKQFYKREVWRLTYQNDLTILEYWDRRGLCGVDGAYQLDHIVSINEGWEKGIDPQEIADMSNLRMIPWKTNRTKGF